MSTIMNAVLQLPREEKIQLLHALQDDLVHDNNIMQEDGLSSDQWAELLEREKMLENGEMEWVTTEGIDDFLNKRRNALQSNKVEPALQLPREEKIELIHTLQEDLQWDDDVLEHADLSKDEWAEITRRERMLETGEAGLMTLDEFTQKLNALQHDLSA